MILTSEFVGEALLYIHTYIHTCTLVRVCICKKRTRKIKKKFECFVNSDRSVCVGVRVFGLHFFVDTYLTKQYRHPTSTHFCIYPFESPHRCFGIWEELVNESPVIIWFPSAFYSILGQHHGCLFSKSDVTLAWTLLLCKCWAFSINKHL